MFDWGSLGRGDQLPSDTELPHTPESVVDEMSNSLSIPCIETQVWNGLLFYTYYKV